MDILKQSILPYLKTSFEKDLLEAVLFNIEDSRNKLRLNNFAYAARELTRHFLERLAPDEDVCNAPWFKPHNPEKPNMITRVQRMKYAIQGYLSDEFFERELNVDFTEVSKNLKNSIDDLSKYTLVNPETFDVDDKTIVDIHITLWRTHYYFSRLLTMLKYKLWRPYMPVLTRKWSVNFIMKLPMKLILWLHTLRC